MYFRASFGQIVCILVGVSRQEFNIHKELLCNISPYFSAALKGNFKEAKEQKIEMLEEDPKAFAYFQLWAYTGCIITEHESEKDITETMLIRLYVFAEAHCIPRLQNAAIDLLVDRIASLNVIPVNSLAFVYANTAESSLLRRLFVDELATTCHLHNPKWFKESTRSIYPADFLFDLIIAQSERVGKERVSTTHFKKVRSDYHASIPADPPKEVQVEMVAPGT